MMAEKTQLFSVPKEVADVAKTLKNKGFQANLIGGCVRDLLIGLKPKDWDITTNARPEQIVESFNETFYENDYGTVGVVNKSVTDETIRVIEVTPFRLEATYSDKRRPDKVTFGTNLLDDLKRRDFTINAIALELEAGEKGKYRGKITDPYSGREDIKKKIIKTVGDPNDRFSEDALRLLRAIRIATDLNFVIEPATERALENQASLLSHISLERIRDEFIRIILSDNPAKGLILSQKTGLLKIIVPELEQAVGVKQNQAHAYNVWEHLLRCLQHAADKKWTLDIRLAALFHDISKPKTRIWSEEKKDWTFHGHDVVGARTTAKILERLKFPNEMKEKVVLLVRWHMFFSDTEQITLSAVRRLVSHVGTENIWDLMNVRICDRVGTGRPKENPYRLRKYKSMIEEVLHDPISVSMLAINGNDIQKIANIAPGPKIGFILHSLLEQVLDNPALNTKEYLEKETAKLSKLTEKELKELGQKGAEKKKNIETKTIEEIRKKYWVS